MKVYKIGDIADVQFGPYLKRQDKGSVKYLLGSHFDDNLQPNNFMIAILRLIDKVEKIYLQSNDVILAGKGHRTFAWAYNDNQWVSNSFFFILYSTGF